MELRSYYNKIKHKIENKRHSNNFLWKLSVLLKDYSWFLFFLYKDNHIFKKVKNRNKNKRIEFNSFKRCNGILHIGANEGQEADFYQAMNKPVVWVEADPDIYKKLSDKLKNYSGQECINELVTDKDYQDYKFYISSNAGDSSSIFNFGKYHVGKNSFWPDKKIHMLRFINLKSKTLKSIYEEYNLYRKKLDFLVLDVQGAELLVLKGAKEIIDSFKYILLEVSKVEIYKGGVLWPEIKSFLNKLGFFEYSQDIPIVGDVLFAKLEYPPKEEIIFCSQLGQDKWVLEKTNYKKSGYFVDVGASDGLNLSNTYALEKEFGWKGICVEPVNGVNDLRENRSCIIDNSCVFSETGKEMKLQCSGDFGGIISYFDKKHKRSGKIVKMKTISLYDLLRKYKSPQNIDYLSIDTEGSEFEIIKNFPFKKYKIKLITIEHNSSFLDKRSRLKRKNVQNLLVSFGYRKFGHKKFTLNYTQGRMNGSFEDWYILKNE